MRQALFLRPDESGHSHGSQGTGIIEWRSFVRSGCAQAIEQGQVVFRCRHGVGCVFVVFVVDDSVEVAFVTLSTMSWLKCLAASEPPRLFHSTRRKLWTMLPLAR